MAQIGAATWEAEPTKLRGGAPYFWTKGGLYEAKHYRAMGEAVWLFGYLLSIVEFETGRTPEGWPYQHTEAARRFEVDVATVRRWFDRLRLRGYVAARRASHGLHIALAKYEPAGERKRRMKTRIVQDELPGIEPSRRANMRTDSRRSPRTSARRQPPTINGVDSTVEITESLESPTVILARGDAPLSTTDSFLAVYFDAIGRPGASPQSAGFKTPDWQALSELYHVGWTADGLRALVRYCLSKPYFQTHPLTLVRLAQDRPQWERSGRPTAYAAPQRGRKSPAAINLERERAEYLERHRLTGAVEWVEGAS